MVYPVLLRFDGGTAVVDSRLDDQSDIEHQLVLEALRVAKWSVPVVLITALSDESIHKVAMGLGAIGLLRKPFAARDMLLAVRSAKATSNPTPA